jgi:signal transduction histidine kinase
MPNQASARLKRNADKIMKYWEDRANNEVLAAMQLESLALRDSLPELLSQIADALSTTIDRTTVRITWDRQESLRVGKKHGHERAESFSYTMDQMIFEYHILRQAICDVMEAEAPLSSVEREVIVCAIEQAVNDAATQFSETLRAIQETLAATLTHDLRGPITSAKMNAQMLLRRPDIVDEGVKASAGQISKSMERLDSMIHDLLDASVIRAGQRLPLKIEECDLDLITREIGEEFNVIYGNRFVVDSKSPAIGFWSISGIRRVIENLATNAAKYGTPHAPITITIQQSKSKVMLSVHNEGKHIPPEVHPVLFQEYRRTHSAHTKTGWGLGLTVVKGVTEAHHGTVRLDSAEDKGVTFTIELPRDAREGLAG